MSGQLPPWILQLAGLVIVIGAAVFWAITNRSTIEFLSAGMTLTTIGAFWNAQQQAMETREYERPRRRREPSDGETGDP